MTVTLTPETETRLRTYAEKLDLDPEHLSNALLARDLEEAEAELQETMDGLDQSVEDYNAGRWITAEEMSRQLKAHVAKIRAAEQAKASDLDRRMQKKTAFQVMRFASQRP